MHMWNTFLQWITRASEKSEKLSFKNQREAAEFVQRLYEESGGPNRRLRELYANGRSLRGLPAHEARQVH